MNLSDSPEYGGKITQLLCEMIASGHPGLGSERLAAECIMLDAEFTLRLFRFGEPPEDVMEEILMEPVNYEEPVRELWAKLKRNCEIEVRTRQVTDEMYALMGELHEALRKLRDAHQRSLDVLVNAKDLTPFEPRSAPFPVASEGEPDGS